MHKITTRIIATVLTGAMVLSLCSCRKKEEDLLEELLKLGNSFIESVAEEDLRGASKLTNGADPFKTIDLDDASYLIYNVIGQASLKDPDRLVISDDGDEVRMKVKLEYLSYFDLKYGTDDSGFKYCMTEDDYLAAINNKDNLSLSNFTLRFVKDGDDWKIASATAARLMDRLTKGWIYGINPVTIDPEEAKEIYISALEEIAAGNLMNDYFSIPTAGDLVNYDNIIDKGSGPEVEAAKKLFISEYVAYILNHSYSISSWDESDPFTMNFTGEAPSRDEIYEYIRDTFMVFYYAEWFKFSELGQSYDDTVNNISAGLYSELASAIKTMDSEPYSLYMTMYHTTSDDPYMVFTTDLVLAPDRALYEAQNAFTPEQSLELGKAALSLLLTQGDITAAQFNEYNRQIEEDYGEQQGQTTDPVQGELYPNQAVNTEEYVPSFSDGSLVYAESYVDENGYWMFYSKEDGVLDTVHYYLCDQGIYITCIFENDLSAGTTLIADWWENGELVIDTDTITIGETGNTVTVFMRTNSFPDQNGYEMRLWEADHSHVLAYVQLNKA